MVVKTLIGSDDTSYSLPIQAVQACCGFIIGRQLTKDGTTLFGRTEDYPLLSKWWKAQQKLCGC